MWSGDESLAATSGEGEVQRVCREHAALPAVTTVEVDDITHLTLQVINLVRPIGARGAVPVCEILLTPEHGVPE